jgi:hypothetical protein
MQEGWGTLEYESSERFLPQYFLWPFGKSLRQITQR